MATKKISPSEVIRLFDAGYTRLEKDNVNNIGSIEKYYDLSPWEKKTLFNHPKIKGYRRKAITPVTMEIIDDLPSMEIIDDVPTSTNNSNNVYANIVAGIGNLYTTETEDLVGYNNNPSEWSPLVQEVSQTDVLAQ
jgi:hypothetical protein